MKIIISKSQWNLLKYSQLDELEPDEIKFFQKLPKNMQQNIIEEINSKNAPISEVKKLLQYLKKTEHEIMDRTPAPPIDKLNQIIEQIKMSNPQDPMLQSLEELREQTMEISKMTSQEDKEGIQNAVNSILDQFKQGKITKKQLQYSLEEFAKRKNNIIKQAQGRMNRDQEDADIDKQQKVQKQENEAKQEKLQIAKTIIEQLGGNRFAAMTGAKNFTSLGNGLSFKLPGAGFTKNSINYVKIILDPSDTYTVEFGKIRGINYKVINTLNDVYFDQLQEIFTRETGLNTHL